MTTPPDIITWVEQLQGWPIHHEEGVHHGRADTGIGGVTVCWKASPGAIAEAGQRGDTLIIGHESLHYPYYFDFDPDRTPGWREWTVNTRRMERLDRYGQTYLRLHSTIDHLCIAAAMAAWLDLGEPIAAANGRTVYEIDTCTVGELADRVKCISGLPAIRVSTPTNLDMPVRRIGLLVGGAGLCANGGAYEPGVRAGIDAFIAGEVDNYGFRYATECGIALIETSHEVCENPGLRRFADMLRKRFPELRVTFYENWCPYRVS